MTLPLLFMGVCAFVAIRLNLAVDRYLAGIPFKAKAVFRIADNPRPLRSIIT